MVACSRYGRAGLLAIGVIFLALFMSAAPARADASKAPDISSLRLSDKDARLYRQVFTAHVRGDRAAVRKLSQGLSDKSLLRWAGIGGNAPAPLWQGEDESTLQYTSPRTRTPAQQKAAALVRTRVVAHIRADRLDWANDSLENALRRDVIDRIEAAQITATIASAYLYNNDTRQALQLAHLALQIGGKRVPEAGWIAGLASWRLGKYAQAARYFSWAPRSPYAGPWMRAAASYWTARSLMQAGHYQQVSAWLMEAAKHPRSFYGLIATRTLGSRFDFAWDVPDFNDTHARVLKKYPGAVRALKLAQAGQMVMAQAELSLLDAESHSKLREALAALAVSALKPDLAMQVAGMLQTPLGGTLDVALYPVSPWHPRDGYRVDPALLNAFIRQESRFKPAAENKGSGAAGLMQIMPRTAKAVDKTIKQKDLSDPAASLSLGQKYLEDLLDMTDGNLFEAAIAYNAGPTRLNEWKRRFAEVDDPLLFIEIIPYGETRAYVERVMANYWIYSLRMGHGVATLDAVAGGRVAQYAPPSTVAGTAGGETIALGKLQK